MTISSGLSTYVHLDNNSLTRVVNIIISAINNSMETGESAIVAGTTRTRAGAYVMNQTYNSIDTATAPAAGAILGDGVALPVSTVGHTVVRNNTAFNIQVYASGSDTINGIAGATGVVVPPGDTAFFACAVVGAWSFDAGLGTAGKLSTVLSADSIAATGTTQATAKALVAGFNRITTATGGSAFGIALPTAVAGLSVVVMNTSSVAISAYPVNAGADQINGKGANVPYVIQPNSVVEFSTTVAANWYTSTSVNTHVPTAYNTNATAPSANIVTLTAANQTGGASEVVLAYTGTASAGFALTTDTAANIIAAIPNAGVGQTYKLRVINVSSTQTATVTAGAGVTVNGTATIATATWRDFVVTVATSSTITMQNMGGGSVV